MCQCPFQSDSSEESGTLDASDSASMSQNHSQPVEVRDWKRKGKGRLCMMNWSTAVIDQFLAMMTNRGGMFSQMRVALNVGQEVGTLDVLLLDCHHREAGTSDISSSAFFRLAAWARSTLYITIHVPDNVGLEVIQDIIIRWKAFLTLY